MKISAVRRVYLQNRSTIDAICLTKTQHHLLASIRNEGRMTTPDIAEMLGCSIQNANIKVRALCRKGWVTRTDIGAPSGGILHEYRAKP